MEHFWVTKVTFIIMFNPFMVSEAKASILIGETYIIAVTITRGN